MRMKKYLIAVLCILMSLSFVACKEKPKEPQMTPPGGPGGGPHIEKGEKKIVVPDSVKGKWSSVILTVTEKATSKTEEVKVKLNSEYTIPKTSLKVKVGEFLPDFSMQGLNITSNSNEPKNPAVSVKVFDGDKEIFSGWLWSNFPTMHPFEHEKYELQLKEGVKAS